ncbi:MAG: DUF885 domain-containing protein [Verrucomicrobia bacterium]|nr:DUF885 domain-containing protein [Verrucomicrobiota bacterium]
MAGDGKQTGTASKELEQLFADDWEFTLQEHPTFATSFGDHRFDDQLGRRSEADHERRHAKAREFLTRANAINRGALSPGEQLNYDLFKRDAELGVERFRFRAYRMPISKMGGFYSSFAELPVHVPLRTAEHYENYIARIRAFSQYTDDHIEVMRAGMRDGQVPPGVTLDGVEKTIEPHIVADPEQSPLFKPLKEFPTTVPEKDRARLVEAGRAAIAESLLPATKRFLEFVTKEYVPAARTEIAATALPDGEAYYAHCVRANTTLDLTPREIHETGLAEVKRIRGEMDEVIGAVKFNGDFKAFVEFLRTDPQFYAATADELMKENAYVLKRMDGELPRLFGRLPRVPYGIRRVPDYTAPNTTTAYYSRAAGDGSRAGFYYINTYDLKSRPLYEIEALALHEAVPGHHLQIALQQELENLPNFRRFGGFTAFVEGWALYAERLGLEAGFYTDPYRNFGRLTYEMWRSTRLVVDTGIHALGWTRQRAIDFMADNTALTLLNIRNEVDRYIAWPGQALAYKTGEIKIRGLRRRAEQTLGMRFDIRAFHDELLGQGALPLDVLELRMNAWITAQQKG